MDHFPAFLDLRGRLVVVVGGGHIAARKIELLIRTGARIRVVAPRIDSSLLDLAARGRIETVVAPFAAAHLDGASLAVAAVNDAEVNRAVSEAGTARHIFVNAVDDSQASTLLMPAIVDRSPLIVAIGTSGASPTLASRVRAQIEALLPESLGVLAGVAGRWRERVRAAVPDLAHRRRFWDSFFSGAGVTTDALALDAQLHSALAVARNAIPRGEVWLIGAGPGDPDLLTLRALQLLQQCDVVLYDRLVSGAVLERVRRDAVRVFVGKETGRHYSTQAHINEMLLEYAGKGLRVARLKGGDPLVFARGGEEIAALAAAGYSCTVVPGVTAAFGAAAAAGIPLTHRAVSQSVTFVTAMGEAASALDWRALSAPLQTVVFYMGVAQLARIVDSLIAHGAPASRPLAIVEHATLPGQRVISGTLADIVQLATAARVQSPALLIVGDVVHHAAHNLRVTE
jgi:uroporphyrin-III C-methyltransferase/precorrin-2 dehydrogenase/sirohydrochlorin ferrochelatase